MLERSEDRKQRNALQDLLLRLLDRRSIDDHDIAGVNLRILRLAAANGYEVECRRLPLAADRSEYSDPMRIRIFCRSSGKRDRLHQGGVAGDWKGTRLLDRAIHRD